MVSSSRVRVLPQAAKRVPTPSVLIGCPVAHPFLLVGFLLLRSCMTSAPASNSGLRRFSCPSCPFQFVAGISSFRRSGVHRVAQRSIFYYTIFNLNKTSSTASGHGVFFQSFGVSFNPSVKAILKAGIFTSTSSNKLSKHAPLLSLVVLKVPPFLPMLRHETTACWFRVVGPLMVRPRPQHRRTLQGKHSQPLSELSEPTKSKGLLRGSSSV